MTSRDEMLAEMGISPLWKFRQTTTKIGEFEQQKPESGEGDGLALAGQDAVVTADFQPVAPEASWEALLENIHACQACELCQHRRQAVPGVGDRQADWLFIGEGPGAEEDARGEPFVGQAGKLLDAMLAAIDLRRGEGVYIANAVKCRPPGNRTPEASEMAACRPFLERQISMIRPKIIVLLGKAAVHTVLGEDRALAGLRGKMHDYQGIPVIVTYHPAYLLRNLPDKAKAWEDLLMARRTLRQAKSGVRES